MSTTGWFIPRLPYFILYVVAPAASASSWFPRQMPNTGSGGRPSAASQRPRRPAPAMPSLAGAMRRRSVAIVVAHIEGSPGPFDTKTPSYSAADGLRRATCRVAAVSRETQMGSDGQAIAVATGRAVVGRSSAPAAASDTSKSNGTTVSSTPRRAR